MSEIERRWVGEKELVELVEYTKFLDYISTLDGILIDLRKMIVALEKSTPLKPEMERLIRARDECEAALRSFYKLKGMKRR